MDHKPTPLVSAKQVLHAISEIRRRGRWPLFQELEAAEPDLTDFVLEETSAIHHELLKASVKPRAVRRLQDRLQSLVLVCVLSLRQSRDGETTQPDPPAANPDPPP